MANPKMTVFLAAVLSICAQQASVCAFICSSKQRSTNHIQKVSSFTAAAAASADDNNDEFFDPFLHSPHSYPDGIENDPSYDNEDDVEGMIVDAIFESSASSFGFMSISEPSSSSATQITNNNGGDDMFDPLLSPHAYPDGVDAGPQQQQQQQQQQMQQSKKLGIILIDHGSKREASNQHLHFIAQTYQASITQRDSMANGEGGSTATSGRQTVVRAAHMEISQPSILESLVSTSSVSLLSALYSPDTLY